MLIPGWLAQIHSLQLWKKRTNEHLSKLVVPDYFDSNTETEKRTLEEKPHSSDALPKKTKDRIEEVGTIDRRKEKIDSYY
ncbi:hypothetical protein AX774_g2447 [Zancudomyces culisetae]|uniref:Uncharacterized protein n=1 Tax=Zancudomyces culisetae TaxID=1213189 RepID=A0A1R1PSV4_ZANCU|nr:hypothetical protein AX774_g2447 [Zancudomyces culisetae]|eukprot:OMH84031.1 hypothetical protein AX774_g2447 [Zancudomyces culisetae]